MSTRLTMVLFLLASAIWISAEDRYVDISGDWRGNGRISSPFQTVIEAVLDVSPGASVFVAPGSYPEKMFLKKPMQLRAMGGTVNIGRNVQPGFITCDGTMRADDDGDGIDDACEEALAQKYAPTIYHTSDESNFPTSVDRFLQRTTLRFFDDDCFPDLKEAIIVHPTQSQLVNQPYTGNCGAEDTVFSSGTRSEGKHRTFYLEDVPDSERGGSPNTQDWITYYHAYPNDSGGVTIQYWRFYAYNDAGFDHGGDWEGIHVVLNSTLAPAEVLFLGHVGIERLSADGVEWEGTHPRVFSEGGGHASHPHQRFCSYIPGTDILVSCDTTIQARNCSGQPTGALDLEDPCTFIRQETWRDGQVHRPSGETSTGGGLLNLGAKVAPLNGQYFVQYSGIWGSPGSTIYSSGYWGPAYNETSMGEDGFITAWGNGALNTQVRKEWYPVLTSR